MALTEIGAELRSIRAKNGEKQIEMAKKLGVTSALLSAVESGSRNATNELLRRIVSVYGIPPDRAKAMRAAAQKARGTVKIKVDKRSGRKVEAAIEFAEALPVLSDTDLQEIRKIICIRRQARSRN